MTQNKLKIMLVCGFFITGAYFLKSEAYTSKERVYMTAYTSTVAQTDSTPFHTSTGERVRPGIVALSPNLIRKYGYNSTVTIEFFERSLGCNPKILKRTSFITKDTTNARFTNRVDVWLSKYSDAINFGKCRAVVKITPKRK